MEKGKKEVGRSGKLTFQRRLACSGPGSVSGTPSSPPLFRKESGKLTSPLRFLRSAPGSGRASASSLPLSWKESGVVGLEAAAAASLSLPTSGGGGEDV